MNKIVSKLRPTDYWRIGEHESWFADMAAEGMHLKKMGNHFAKFVKGEPKKTRYRIDVSLNKKIIPEQQQMYAKSGWDYVTSYGDFSVYSSPVELNAPELHTDPAEQAYTLKKLDKKLAVSALIVAVATTLIIGMVSSIWFLDWTPTLKLVEGNIVQLTLLTAFYLYLAYNSLQAVISIRILRKTLSEGKRINHNAPWKKHYRVKTGIAILYIIMVIFVVVLPLVQIVQSETKTLPVAGTNLPIVRLADIEQNPELVRESSHMRNNIDWGNRYRYDWSLLTLVQYQSTEHGMVSNEEWKDGSGVYSPSIHTRAYKLRFPAMAENLISDLVKRYDLRYRGGDFIEKEHINLDNLIVYELDEYKQVIASKDKAVMYIRYHGHADMNSIIENAAHMIAQFLNNS